MHCSQILNLPQPNHTCLGTATGQAAFLVYCKPLRFL